MPKKGGIPKTRANGKWSESRYWSFIRSALRRASMRWPPIHEVLALHRRPYKGSRRNVKWLYECCHCKGLFMRKEVQVHHIKPCGTLKTFDDLPAFCANLFCEVEGLEVVCVDCHAGEKHANKKAS